MRQFVLPAVTAIEPPVFDSMHDFDLDYSEDMRLEAERYEETGIDIGDSRYI